MDSNTAPSFERSTPNNHRGVEVIHFGMKRSKGHQIRGVEVIHFGMKRSEGGGLN